ncbi:MAG: hypothetical protein ACRDTD_20375 [Pseudonocardiaceae bacterium]
MLVYTGVLYAALDTGSLQARAVARLAVASALFGLLAADDQILRVERAGEHALDLIVGV